MTDDRPRREDYGTREAFLKDLDAWKEQNGLLAESWYGRELDALKSRLAALEDIISTGSLEGGQS